MTSKPILVRNEELITNCLELFCRKHYVSQQYKIISNLPVVNDAGKYVGMLNYKDILLKLVEFVGDVSVLNLMIEKKKIEVVKVGDTPETAFFLMNSKGFKQVLVVEEMKNGNLYPVGVIREGDLLRVADNKLNNFSVEHLMTKLDSFKILMPRCKLSRAISLFTIPDLDLIIFPVVFQKQLIGAITYIDIIRFVLEKLRTTE